MGLLKTHWEVVYEDCKITIRRNEWTKGFTVECDGVQVAKKSWTLIGLGSVDGELTFADRTIPFTVDVLSGTECSLSIGGNTIKANLLE